MRPTQWPWLLVLAGSLAPAQQSPFLAERLVRLPALLERLVAAGEHAGASFVLFHRDRLVAHGAFGLADAAAGRPMQRDTIVRVYSMTKAVTAVAALVAVEQGRLRLDQPIGDLLPDLAGLRVFSGGTAEAPLLAEAERPITVRMLLTHTAGFTYDFLRASPVHELYRRAALWESASSDDFLRRVAALPLLAQPGTAWNYSIANDVLGVLLERLLERPLDAVVRDLVTGPLGMVDTDFDVPEGKRDRLAAMHRRDGDRLVPIEPTYGVYAESGRGFPAGGAGLFSTLDDFARFVRLLVGDGEVDGVRVLGRKTLELARRDALRGGQRTTTPGAGWGLIAAVWSDPGAGSEPFSPGTVFWNGAATTSFFADPQEGIVGVLFAQHLPFDEHKLIPRFRTAVYQAVR